MYRRREQGARHTACGGAESIEKVGTVEKGKSFDREVAVKVKSTGDLGNLRVIAFVQEADAGAVVGASMVGRGSKRRSRRRRTYETDGAKIKLTARPSGLLPSGRRSTCGMRSGTSRGFSSR